MGHDTHPPMSQVSNHVSSPNSPVSSHSLPNRRLSLASKEYPGGATIPVRSFQQTYSRRPKPLQLGQTFEPELGQEGEMTGNDLNFDNDSDPYFVGTTLKLIQIQISLLSFV